MHSEASARRPYHGLSGLSRNVLPTAARGPPPVRPAAGPFIQPSQTIRERGIKLKLDIARLCELYQVDEEHRSRDQFHQPCSRAPFASLMSSAEFNAVNFQIGTRRRRAGPRWSYFAILNTSSGRLEGLGGADPRSLR